MHISVVVVLGWRTKLSHNTAACPCHRLHVPAFLPAKNMPTPSPTSTITTPVTTRQMKRGEHLKLAELSL